jgi:hypothetical protein
MEIRIDEDTFYYIICFAYYTEWYQKVICSIYDSSL